VCGRPICSARHRREPGEEQVLTLNYNYFETNRLSRATRHAKAPGRALSVNLSDLNDNRSIVNDVEIVSSWAMTR
jgi:hypothetical protein